VLRDLRHLVLEFLDLFEDVLGRVGYLTGQLLNLFDDLFG
jgi:hypothetical protein